MGMVVHLGLMSSPVTNTVPPDNKVTEDGFEVVTKPRACNMQLPKEVAQLPTHPCPHLP